MVGYLSPENVILLKDCNGGGRVCDDDISLLKPRAKKSDSEKFTRSNAEVFTPREMVKFMVDAVDDGRIDSRWLEAACGEAPFITTRYDAESGEDIPVDERVGILDRKLRACPSGYDKLTWATEAVQSVYGYEINGDSLFIARRNVLLTVAEFVGDMTVDELTDIAEIVAKNFWLMDGLNLPDAQRSLFGDTREFTVIDWFDDEKTYPFTKGGIAMKFDVLISNPPYQDDTAGGNKNFASPVYHYFMQEAPKVADKSVLITPARFLFDAGATPKKFNRDMLNDEHFKVLHYEPDAKKVFRNVDIKGGVVVTLRDTTQTFEPIGTFIPFDEMKSVHDKVVNRQDFEPLSKIMRGQMTYRLSTKAYDDFPDLRERLPNRTDTALRTNAFKVMPDIFLTDKPNDGHEYLKIFGLFGTQRVYRYVRREYMEDISVLNKYKVFVPRSNGSGEFGETIPLPFVVSPNVGCTQTFITVGEFDTRDEAEACLTYIKSKFARAMRSILKVTQDSPPPTWAKVPLQDFSASSDIDWRGDVDGQLYRKYNLSNAEIAFIESHVKEMS